MTALRGRLDAAHYIYDDELVTTLWVALKPGRPLLIEGAAGVGKTEAAKVMASAPDRELVRPLPDGSMQYPGRAGQGVPEDYEIGQTKIRFWMRLFDAPCPLDVDISGLV